MVIRLLLFAALLAVAAFNNEKAIWFAPLIVILEWRFHVLGWRRALALASIPVVVYGAVRLAVDAPPPVWTPSTVMARNLELLLPSVLLFVGGALVWLVMLALVWRRVNAWLRVILLCGLIYAAPIVIFGVWNELPRLMLPIYLLSALAVLSRPTT